MNTKDMTINELIEVMSKRVVTLSKVNDSRLPRVCRILTILMDLKMVIIKTDETFLFANSGELEGK